MITLPRPTRQVVHQATREVVRRQLSTNCRWTARSGSSSASSVVLTGFEPSPVANVAEGSFPQPARSHLRHVERAERKSPPEICQISYPACA